MHEKEEPWSRLRKKWTRTVKFGPRATVTTRWAHKACHVPSAAACMSPIVKSCSRGSKHHHWRLGVAQWTKAFSLCRIPISPASLSTRIKGHKIHSMQASSGPSTPIGSISKILLWGKINFEIILHCKTIHHNLGAYSHRERCRTPDWIKAKYQSTKDKARPILFQRHKLHSQKFPSCVRRKCLRCCMHSAKVRPADLSSWAKDRSSNDNP